MIKVYQIPKEVHPYYRYVLEYSQQSKPTKIAFIWIHIDRVNRVILIDRFKEIPKPNDDYEDIFSDLQATGFEESTLLQIKEIIQYMNNGAFSEIPIEQLLTHESFHVRELVKSILD